MDQSYWTFTLECERIEKTKYCVIMTASTISARHVRPPQLWRQDLFIFGAAGLGRQSS